jgi:integrase
MQYLDKDEIRRVLAVAYGHNRRNHLMMVISLWHGLRVSELVNLRGTSFTADGMLIVARLKGSNQTSQPIHRDDNPIFDESPVLILAAQKQTLRLFELSPRHLNRLMVKYCTLANVHPSKAHWHVWKHSTGMLLWDTTQNLGQIQSFLGHKSASSTLCYLYEADSRKASNALAAVRF